MNGFVAFVLIVVLAVGAIFGAAVGFVNFQIGGLVVGALAGFVGAAMMIGGILVSHESKIGRNLVVMLVVFGIAMALLSDTMYKISPHPNPVEVASFPTADCVKAEQALKITGACPTTREGWISAARSKLTPLSNGDWPTIVINNGLMENCPEKWVPVTGPAPNCTLSYGGLVREMNKYLDAKGMIADARWAPDEEKLRQNVLLVGLIGFLAVLLPTIGLTFMIAGQKIVLGSLTFTTAFALAVLFLFGTNTQGLLMGWWFEQYDPALNLAIQKLIGIGAMSVFVGPAIGAVTFALGFGAGELMKWGKTGGFIMGFGTLLVGALAAGLGDMLGLIPNWLYTLGILQVMNANPGLSVTTAMQAMLLGPILVVGCISAPLGPIMTLAFAAVSMAKGTLALGKLGG